MLQDQNRHIAKLLTATALVILVMISFDRASAFETTLTSNPPERCTGYGDLESISLTDWEAGLGSWTVDTHDVADPDTFDTPDWAVAGSLPDSRTGMAAFVANLDIGDCGADDQTGALTLDSPPIVISGGAQVPRISIDHWFQTETMAQVPQPVVEAQFDSNPSPKITSLKLSSSLVISQMSSSPGLSVTDPLAAQALNQSEAW
jgi:hypothetical protein